MSLQYTNKAPIEVVLENGQFARIRRPTRGDFIKSFGSFPNDTTMAMAVLITLTTTVDDEPLTLEQWMDADFELTAPIQNAIGKIFQAADKSQNKGGVA